MRPVVKTGYVIHSEDTVGCSTNDTSPLPPFQVRYDWILRTQKHIKDSNTSFSETSSLDPEELIQCCNPEQPRLRPDWTRRTPFELRTAFWMPQPGP